MGQSLDNKKCPAFEASGTNENNMIRNNTSVLTATVPEGLPERWCEYLSSVTIKIPKKWVDEALPFRDGTTLWVDMTRHFITLAEGFCAFTGGVLYPNIFIKAIPFLPDPKVELSFYKDGIANLDDDGEIKDANHILSEWEIVKVSDHAKLAFFNEAVKFRREWMAKKEEAFSRKEVFA